MQLEDGSANWDITKKDTTAAAPADTAAGRPLAISLRRFDIDSGSVAFDSRASKLKASLVGFDQSLSGDFGTDQLTIETRAHADEVSLEFAGIPYLKKVRLDLSTDVAADLAKKSFTLKESGVRLNDLTLAFSGSVASTADRMVLDVAFGAPKTEFKHILSLVPAVYTRDFESVQTSGSLAVSGKVKGEYAEGAFPSLSLGAKVENGTFRYPDLPLPARDIALDLAITNPGGDADSTTVNLRRFHVVLGTQPGGRRPGDADTDLGSRRGRARRRQGRPGRPPPHAEARGHAGAGGHHRRRCGGAHPDVLDRQRQPAVRPDRRARHGERRGTSP